MESCPQCHLRAHVQLNNATPSRPDPCPASKCPQPLPFCCPSLFMTATSAVCSSCAIHRLPTPTDLTSTLELASAIQAHLLSFQQLTSTQPSHIINKTIALAQSGSRNLQSLLQVQLSFEIEGLDKHALQRDWCLSAPQIQAFGRLGFTTRCWDIQTHSNRHTIIGAGVSS